MDEFLKWFPSILSCIFGVWYIILYYNSIKKCFWKGNKSRVKLFFLTLVSNPLLSYIGTLFFSMIILGVIEAANGTIDDAVKDGWTYIMWSSVIGAVIYIALLFLFSNIIGKWLGAPNRSLVSFVTMMFGVLFSLSIQNEFDKTGDDPYFGFTIEILAIVVLFVASFLLNHFVINELAKLTDKRRELNVKLFIIPPTIFCLFYNVFMFSVMFEDNMVRLTVYIFSTIILFLFIWAFYVIINNINVTNEVIEAKDMAAAAALAEAHIEADLAAAKTIQSSALPSEFPPFPDRNEFELFASMKAAREVGGDFYDFYMLDDHTLGFLIADVSGKSIPGALFMMTSKTVIKNLAERGLSPAEVFTEANSKLNIGNDAEMFLTAWLGYLDLNTGTVRVANAGHNSPILIHDGKPEYVKMKPGFMLAIMDGIRYKEQTLQLEKGDMLFLYTDGVTEAMDINEELYGEERLQNRLTFGEHFPEPSGKNGISEPVCGIVSADLAEFTAGAEQSDDITMLCVRYLGKE